MNETEGTDWSHFSREELVEMVVQARRALQAAHMECTLLRQSAAFFYEENLRLTEQGQPLRSVESGVPDESESLS